MGVGAAWVSTCGTPTCGSGVIHARAKAEAMGRNHCLHLGDGKRESPHHSRHGQHEGAHPGSRAGAQGSQGIGAAPWLKHDAGVKIHSASTETALARHTNMM